MLEKWFAELGMLGVSIVVIGIIYLFLNTNFLTYLTTQWTTLTAF